MRTCETQFSANVTKTEATVCSINTTQPANPMCRSALGRVGVVPLSRSVRLVMDAEPACGNRQ